MDTKKLTMLLTIGIAILGAIVLFMFLPGKNNISQQLKTTVTPKKEVAFAVVRVLPSGFSPQEVTIKKGMIVRFTNPADNKIMLKWDGGTQYTKDAVYVGHDMATTVFDTVGTYTFSDDATKLHSGKVVVE